MAERVLNSSRYDDVTVSELHILRSFLLEFNSGS